MRAFKTWFSISKIRFILLRASQKMAQNNDHGGVGVTFREFHFSKHIRSTSRQEGNTSEKTKKKKKTFLDVHKKNLYKKIKNIRGSTFCSFMCTYVTKACRYFKQQNSSRSTAMTVLYDCQNMSQQKAPISWIQSNAISHATIHIYTPCQTDDCVYLTQQTFRVFARPQTQLLCQRNCWKPETYQEVT